MSILCRKFGHKWSGCKCQRCGEVRDESHNWHGCTCIICGMTRAGIGLDRKVLADIAVHDKEAFAAIVEQAKAKLA